MSQCQTEVWFSLCVKRTRFSWNTAFDSRPCELPCLSLIYIYFGNLSVTLVEWISIISRWSLKITGHVVTVHSASIKLNNSCELKSHWWEIQDDHLAFPSSLANLIVISWVKAFPDYLALLPHDGKKMVKTYVPCGVYLPQSLVIKVPPSPYRSYKPSLKLLETITH